MRRRQMRCHRADDSVYRTVSLGVRAGEGGEVGAEEERAVGVTLLVELQGIGREGVE